MTGRNSSATDRALALIGTPRSGGRVWTAYAAAQHVGISLNTIYRARKRLRIAQDGAKSGAGEANGSETDNGADVGAKG